MARSGSVGKVLGALVALLLLTTACGSSGGTAAAPVAPVDDVNHDGILRLGRDLTIATAGQIDPITVDAALDTLHENIFGTLLRINADDVVVPDLAESVKIVDASNLVVTLRSGLTFTDATVLDAAALKFSWERTLAQAKAGGIEAEFREIDTLTVASPLVLNVKLKTPIAGAFYRLMRLAESSPVSPTAVKSGADFNKSPVGAGPFKLVSVDLGSSIKLARNPAYWDAAHIQVAGIEYVNVTSQSLTNAVRSNTIDFSLLGAQQATETKGAPHFAITVAASSVLTLQGLWCKSRPPFDNLKVRQALNYAVDKAALNEVVFGGAGEAMDGFNSSTTLFYDKSLKDFYKYDPEKAKKLLVEAGVSNLSFDMYYLPGADAQKAAELLQQQFDKVGVKVAVKALNNAADFFPNATGAPITVMPLARVGASKVTRVLVPPSFGNICNWNDPELNALTLRLQGVDETSAEGISLWKQISKNGLSNALHLFGVFGTQGMAVDESRLGGVEVYADRYGLPALDMKSVFVRK
jgi:peptide/nickel transport system substrate-binding protein